MSSTFSNVEHMWTLDDSFNRKFMEVRCVSLDPVVTRDVFRVRGILFTRIEDRRANVNARRDEKRVSQEEHHEKIE